MPQPLSPQPPSPQPVSHQSGFNSTVLTPTASTPAAFDSALRKPNAMLSGCRAATVVWANWWDGSPLEHLVRPFSDLDNKIWLQAHTNRKDLTNLLQVEPRSKTVHPLFDHKQHTQAHLLLLFVSQRPNKRSFHPNRQFSNQASGFSVRSSPASHADQSLFLRFAISRAFHPKTRPTQSLNIQRALFQDPIDYGSL
jgi:hypothetical protein